MKLKDLRNQLQEQRRIRDKVAQVQSVEASTAAKVALEIEELQLGQLISELEKLPIERIKDATETKIKVEYLRRNGYLNAADIYRVSSGTIASIQGISPEVAVEIKSIVDAMAKAITQTLNIRISPNLENRTEAQLVADLEYLNIFKEKLRPSREILPELREKLNKSVADAAVVQSRLKWWFAGKDKRALAVNSLYTAGIFLGLPHVVMGAQAVETVLEFIPQKEKPVEELRSMFGAKSSTYYSLLEDIQGKPLAASTLSHFDQALINAIEGQEFDDALIKASMRKYQIFGTKFALTQKRVILGDEMGLGKTMQALGVITERHKAGAKRTLVVCPASVIINWTREIMDRTDLIPLRIHGDTQKVNLAKWVNEGGLALTTFDTLKSFAMTDEELATFKLDTIIVDEAHFAKNLHTGRSVAIQKWVSIAHYAIFLTGTPMENRIEEFMGLAAMLNRNIASALDLAVLAAGPEPFKVAVAPIYLRRNSIEVLKELPDLIESLQDCDWTGVSEDFYTEAVRSGNFMAMRRATYVPFENNVPSKMARLIELVDEAFENNEKVIVFSYFRKVLDSVLAHLGDRAVGPITGGVTPARRQAIIDDFTNSPTPKALVGQIQAAGTGLNIQSASVVILCEPQIKPSLETQAIARAHRMGQVKTVQVHRLHVESSVDAGLRAMLGRKQAEFDDYARYSALADGSSQAKDVAEHSLARTILLQERQRLNIESDADLVLKDEEI